MCKFNIFIQNPTLPEVTETACAQIRVLELESFLRVKSFSDGKMQQIGAALWPKLQCIQIYGANTNVGKTIVSAILGTALRSRNVKTNYIKPVSTGPTDEADHR